jgi:hypothetical protein
MKTDLERFKELFDSFGWDTEDLEFTDGRSRTIIPIESQYTQQSMGFFRFKEDGSFDGVFDYERD